MARWISGKEAAIILDTTPDWIRKLCREKRIRCKKLGREWMIDSSSLNGYAQSERKRGPKPKTYTGPESFVAIKDGERDYQERLTVTITLTEEQIGYLLDKFGSVSRGVEILINKAMKLTP